MSKYLFFVKMNEKTSELTVIDKIIMERMAEIKSPLYSNFN